MDEGGKQRRLGETLEANLQLKLSEHIPDTINHPGGHKGSNSKVVNTGALFFVSSVLPFPGDRFPPAHNPGFLLFSALSL